MTTVRGTLRFLLCGLILLPAFLAVLPSCLLPDCALAPDTPGCLVIDAAPRRVVRNDPLAFTVKFLDSDSISALAMGAAPRLELRPVSGAADPFCAQASSFSSIRSSSVVGMDEQSVYWALAQDEVRALGQSCSASLELVASVDGMAESNAVPIELCPTFSIEEQVLLSFGLTESFPRTVRARPNLSGNIVVFACKDTGSCVIYFYDFDRKHNLLTQKADSIHQLTTQSEMSPFAEDMLIFSPGDMGKKFLYRFSKSVQPTMTVPDIFVVDDSTSRLRARTQQGLVALIGMQSLHILAEDRGALVERPVFYRPPPAAEPSRSAIADFSGDGLADLFFVPGQTTAASAQSVLLVRTGDGFWPDAERTLQLRNLLNRPEIDRQILDIAAADMDRDGQVDLVVFDGQQAPKLHVLAASPCVAAPIEVRLPAECQGSQTIDIADMDQDGDEDIVLADPRGHELCILFNGVRRKRED